MKRNKPAATPPSPSAQPQSQGLPATPIADGRAEEKAESPEAHSTTTSPFKLGLSTTEPDEPPIAAATPTPHPKETPALEPSQVPPILLEGDEPKPVERSGTDRKFAGPSQPEAGRAEPGKQELPESYGTGHLLLTARDPNCLYAHWDLTAKQQQEHASLSIQKHLHLRVHQESLSGPVISEIQVPPQTHHSFVSVDAPGARRFVADLGYYPETGSWRSIAAGETTVALAPPPLPALIRFTTLSFGPAKQSPVSTAAASPPSAAAKTSAEPSVPAPTLSFPLPKPLPAFAEPFATAATAEVVPPEEPQNWRELSADPEALAAFGDLVDENSGGPAQVMERLGGQWTAAQERALAELVGWSVLRSESLGSGSIEELIRGIVPTSQAAELSSIALAGGPALPSSMALGAGPAEQQGFWFNLNAELVIYGATQPNATVTIAGRPIALRSDGTFSYRFALPDGQYHLPLAAHSVHGEKREATLNFSRATGYSEGVGAHAQDPHLTTPAVENIS